LVLEPPGIDRSFWHHVGANAECDGTAFELTGVELLHVGYPSLLPAMTADGGEPLVALFARARAAGITTSLDLAVVDPASPAARLDWSALLRRVLPLVDVLSPSVADVRTTFRGPGAGPRNVVRTSATLGDRTSTSGSTRRSSADQSSRAAGEAGSTTARSSDVVIPAARARANSATSGSPPSAVIAGSSDGYPTCSSSTPVSSKAVPSH